MLGDNPLTPVKHSFSDGLYMREMFIPKGTVIVGKIHNHSHPSFLLKGDITVYSEDKGEQRLRAPKYFVSPAGVKRVGYAHEDTIWITIHLNEENSKDLKKLEKEITSDSYEEFEKFLDYKGNKIALLNE